MLRPYPQLANYNSITKNYNKNGTENTKNSSKIFTPIIGSLYEIISMHI